MCEKSTERPESKAKKAPEGAGSRDSDGCPCEPRRCLPIAGAVLAAVAVPLMIRAIKRSRRGAGKQECGAARVGCCA